MTLIEILVGVGILCILATLIFTSLQSSRQRAKGVTCTSNLRQVGVALFAFAAENNGRIYLGVEKQGSGGSIQWLRYLVGMVDNDHNRRASGGPVYIDNLSVAVCPSIRPFYYSGTTSDYVGYTYGACGGSDADPVAVPPPGTKASSRGIPLAAIERPSRYWLLSDSMQSGADRQLFHISRNLGANYGVHFRHQGKANTLFADGHVEAVLPEDFAKLPYNPVTAGFNEKNDKMEFSQ